MYVFVCVYFFHRFYIIIAVFKFFFEIFSAAHFFVCKFFLRKKDAEPLHRISFFVFFIMTMKTSSIILCFFLMIEPLTLNCAYFRKKKVFCYVFWALEGSRYFCKGREVLFWENIFWEGFLLFLYIKLSSLLLRKEKKRFS